MESRLRKKTYRTRNSETQVPAAVSGEKAGPAPSSSSYCSRALVDHLASASGGATRENLIVGSARGVSREGRRPRVTRAVPPTVASPAACHLPASSAGIHVCNKIVSVRLTRCDRVNSSRNSELNLGPIQNKRNQIRVIQLNMHNEKQASAELRQTINDLNNNDNPLSFKNEHVDVLLLQEPYSRIEFRGGKAVHKFTNAGREIRFVASKLDKPYAAIGVCNPTFGCIQIAELSTPFCACAEILTPRLSESFYAVSCYFKHAHNIEPHIAHLQKVLIALRGKRIIIGIDANAESSAWSPRFSRASRDRELRGGILSNFIDRVGLVLLNDKNQPHTYEGNRGISWIDITLASPSMVGLVRSWNVREELATFSDHRALEIMLETPRERETQTQQRPSRFNTRKADWDKFEHELEQSRAELLEAPLTSSAEVESLANALTQALTKACEASMPRKKLYRKINPWWTKDLTQAKRRTYRSRRAYQRESDAEIRQVLKIEYRVILREYSRLVDEEQKTSWRNCVTRHGNSQPWGAVYKLQRGKRSNLQVLSTLRTKDGSTADMRTTVNKLLEEHYPDDNIAGETPEQTQIRAESLTPPDTDDCPSFMTREVVEAVKTFKNGKAPGPDLIEVSVLKAAVRVIPEIFTRLFNGCLRLGVFPAVWKVGTVCFIPKGDEKDPTDPKSVRPITLLPHPGKLFERLINNRLENVKQTLSSRQFGFLSGKSCEDAIAAVRKAVESAEPSEIVAGLFFDIVGAFSNIWRPYTMKTLKDKGCSRNIWLVLQNYFQGREVVVPLPSGEVRRLSTKGAAQGSGLGGTLWIVSFDPMIRVIARTLREVNAEYEEDNSTYADDTCAILKATSMEKLGTIGNTLVNNFRQACQVGKLEVSGTKTEGMILKFSQQDKKLDSQKHRAKPKESQHGKTRSRSAERFRHDRRAKHPRKKINVTKKTPTIKLGNIKIKFQESVRYLGVHFGVRMSITPHCEYLQGKIKPFFNKLRRLSGTDWGLNFSTKLKIFRGVLHPIIAFAAGEWADLCKAPDFKILQRAHYSALLSITRAYNYTAYDAVCVLAGDLPIDLQVKIRLVVRLNKKGLDAKIGQINIPANTENAKEVAEAEALKMWQSRWSTSDKGRTTFSFFPNIRERLRLGHISPDYYVTQALCGHGNFGTKLNSLGRPTVVDCACGEGFDLAEHHIFKCSQWAPMREALSHIIDGKELPEAAQSLVSTPENYTLFSDFVREILWIKQEVDRQQQEAETAQQEKDEAQREANEVQQRSARESDEEWLP